MYKLVVSRLAHEDLGNIIAYIKNTLCAPQAASNFAADVQKCYARLKKSPLIYALCNDIRLAREGYRKASVKNYVLVFKVDEAKKTVSIYRIFYSAEDYPNKI